MSKYLKNIKTRMVAMGKLTTVIGTVFVDVKGFPQDKLHHDTRNVGQVEFVHGGVGRNVVETLSKMGVECNFLSSVDKSGLGEEVLTRLKNCGVDTQYIKKAPSSGMGMWLAILNEKGDLALSISQMPNLSYMEKVIDKYGEEIFVKSDAIILETDLNINIVNKILKLAKEHKVPVYGLVGNLELVREYPEIIGKLSCFICNKAEAELLFGTILHSHEDVKKATLKLYEKGLEAAVITLGAQGSIYYGKGMKEPVHQKALKVQVVDTTGAGDAFFTGTVFGLVKGYDLSKAVICGTKAAAWTIESKESVCTDLDLKASQDKDFIATA